ncbi:hypothetical protein AAVH_16851 [Aphelenchoides avenae]|nr:hypothetical protein AAVH_16851 [Aphelenchus avenae]
MDVDDTPEDKIKWRRPDTLRPRASASWTWMAPWWRKTGRSAFVTPDVSIDTRSESEDAFSTPAPVAIPPENATSEILYAFCL